MIYQSVVDASRSGRKRISVLIDPDKYNDQSLEIITGLAVTAGIDFFLVGGSLILNNERFNKAFNQIKKLAGKIPVIAFPGSLLQIPEQADAFLLLSPISGRNPDFLVGNHVVSASLLKKLKAEKIPTGYILIDGGRITSTGYMSNTIPIPADKTDIAISTAIAGELLGLKLIYLEAGSGALFPVSPVMISEVKKNLTIPLIVGGGIKTPGNIKAACEAGADMLVIGNVFEKDPALVCSFTEIIHNYIRQ